MKTKQPITMKTKHALCGLLSGLLLLAAGTAQTHAALYTTDHFGSGDNAFSIQFATVGNAGNANDAGAGGGSYFSPHGGVSYSYRIGVTEVPQDWITKATALGMTNVTAGAWSASQPAANMTWYEAAAFVNFLNTSTGHQKAYNLNPTNTALTLWTPSDAGYDATNRYRNANAYYFLPSENEWYKAAFHKNDGPTADYWDYATGSNTAPTPVPSGTTAGTAVYASVTAVPAGVTLAGGLSPYGTVGQGGNVWDWLESGEIAGSCG